MFVLLNRLNEDWGWGQSQRTGESGLIPLLLMEDVVSYPNYMHMYVYTLWRSLDFSLVPRVCVPEVFHRLRPLGVPP